MSDDIDVSDYIAYFSDLKPAPIEWLWYPFARRRQVSLFAGPSGIGKSTLLSDIMARFSRGELLPGESEDQEFDAAARYAEGRDRAIYLNFEEAMDEDPLQRAIAANTNDMRLMYMKERIRFPHDEAVLTRCVHERDVGVIIVDPLSSFLDIENENSNREWRGKLEALGDFATDHDVSVVAVHHYGKAGETARGRVRGASALVDTVRSGVVVDHHPDDPDTRVVAPIKFRIHESLAYSLAYQIQIGGSVTWLGKTDLRADQLGNTKENEMKRELAKDKAKGAIHMMMLVTPEYGAAHGHKAVKDVTGVGDKAIRSAVAELRDSCVMHTEQRRIGGKVQANYWVSNIYEGASNGGESFSVDVG